MLKAIRHKAGHSCKKMEASEMAGSSSVICQSEPENANSLTFV